MESANSVSENVCLRQSDERPNRWRSSKTRGKHRAKCTLVRACARVCRRVCPRLKKLELRIVKSTLRQSVLTWEITALEQLTSHIEQAHNNRDH